MKKLLFLIPAVILFLASCKKNDLTVDGKPVSDAANNMVRVDVKAGASYKLLVAQSSPTVQNQTNTLYTNDNLTSSYEYAFKGIPGNVMLVEVYSQNGTYANCDVYYKGLKVPVSLEGIDQLQGEMP
ncbi:MAG TPA: hypothetical protein VFE53_18930, partial [Mucilaginibacter sp.]|nr:hypothetical protein [Mucilaginibacter sp.]